MRAEKKRDVDLISLEILELDDLQRIADRQCQDVIPKPEAHRRVDLVFFFIQKLISAPESKRARRITKRNLEVVDDRKCHADMRGRRRGVQKQARAGLVYLRDLVLGELAALGRLN